MARVTRATEMKNENDVEETDEVAEESPPIKKAAPRKKKVEPVESDPEVDVEDEEEEAILSVEDVDPSEEIWPNGPTAGNIVEWKKDFGDVYITSLNFDNHIVWRTLFRSEYRDVVREIERVAQSEEASASEVGMLQEELVCEKCILFPELNGDFSGKLAGMPTILAEQILEASGFIAYDTRQL